MCPPSGGGSSSCIVRPDIVGPDGSTKLGLDGTLKVGPDGSANRLVSGLKLMRLVVIDMSSGLFGGESERWNVTFLESDGRTGCRVLHSCSSADPSAFPVDCKYLANLYDASFPAIPGNSKSEIGVLLHVHIDIIKGLARYHRGTC